MGPVNPTAVAARAGLRRGWIELRNSLTNVQDMASYLFPALILLSVTFFARGSHVPGTTFSMGAQMLPGALGMGIAFTGLIGIAQQLLTDREDGTLLRAKAIPNGMRGYLVGKIVMISGVALLGMSLQLVPGLLLLPGFSLGGGRGLLTLAWVVVLGLVATLPIGAVIGSLFDNPRNMGLLVMPILGLVAVSGIFYPISGFPGWLQGVVQIFPIYWLGLGMRSALLPADLAAVEIGHSWRHLETVAALCGWAVLGLVLAPVVLRRMARRESGSHLEARRQRALQRTN